MASDPPATEKLAPYRRKRNFSRTSEPEGEVGDTEPAAPAPAGRRFVVQRHRARRLHYDVRFEIDGVLVSWAVPKGPTLDPAARHAAFHVEDHPIEYIDFEGVIPAGEYGGGDVIVWDAGTWEPVKTRLDPATAVARGELQAELYGSKLRGRFVLVRTGADSGGKEHWLMLHKRDDFAVPGWDPEQHPRSVLSGRTNDEVLADPDRMWRSDLPAAEASIALKDPASGRPSADELAALEELPASGGHWEVFGRELKVTNLDKVLFPGSAEHQPVTKREFLRYTAQIAPVALPYLAGRALNMHRYPQGAGSKGFWHKELPDWAPDWLTRWQNPDADPGETRTYLVVNEPAALVWAANFGALEWHAWTSMVDRPQQPSYALIDIDPGGSTSWQDVLVLARLHRTAFEHLGMLARPKVTGRRGIQIWVPITRGPSFAETRRWVEQLSKTVGAVVPELLSWKWEVRDRAGKARLDYTQNAINKTLVAPYSARPAPGAPVSMPIGWEELDDPELRPDGFALRTVPQRIAEKGDLFRPLLGTDQTLPRLG
ncbi:DNA polymerase ligase N-terminal domain-containing protein [Jatrophihabitans sp.]|uniref:non-homologous end-joining DNA ligase LigD n=1 Tax=Jatrophihabitans sp. TaxID=1932789 RepID=UPI002BA98B5A|nr:DNA polymerase ligase N-terminal domain-containing protein [Jatrophihabitans sp.]